MEDSGAILCQISYLKDMLDQVNEEIESNIQITREIESEIVKCQEMESALAAHESDLTKALYFSHFDIHGLLSVAKDSRNSLRSLEEKEICCLRKNKEETIKRINDKRIDGSQMGGNWRKDRIVVGDGFHCTRHEKFVGTKCFILAREQFARECLHFQRDIDKGEDDEVVNLLSEKEFLENEIRLLDRNNNALRNSMLAFVDEVLQDLNDSNYALQVEIQSGNCENGKLLKEINDLKTALVSSYNGRRYQSLMA